MLVYARDCSSKDSIHLGPAVLWKEWHDSWICAHLVVRLNAQDFCRGFCHDCLLDTMLLIILGNYEMPCAYLEQPYAITVIDSDGGEQIMDASVNLSILNSPILPGSRS